MKCSRYSRRQIQQSLQGGYDLSAGGTAYDPWWTVFFGGFIDIQGQPRTGNGSTGYTMGSVEVD